MPEECIDGQAAQVAGEFAVGDTFHIVIGNTLLFRGDLQYSFGVKNIKTKQDASSS